MIGLTVFVVAVAAAVILAGWAALQAPRWAAAAWHRATRPQPGSGTHERRDVPRVFDRTLPPAGDKAQREAAYDTLRELPAPGMTIYTDRNVWLPRTPQLAEPGPPIVASLTDVPDRRHGAAERLATDTDVRAIAAVLPAWVIEALNGHDGVDACVESIAARAGVLNA